MSRSERSTLPSLCRRSTALRSSSAPERMETRSSVLEPNSRSTPRTSTSMARSTGPKIATSGASTRANRSDTWSALLIATVLGNTSAKTSSSTVMMAVAHTAPCSPITTSRTLVMKAEEPMLTSVLPSSVVPISRSRRRSSLLTSAARLSPLRSSACMRAREAPVSAVSEAAKKADMAMQKTMIATAT